MAIYQVIRYGIDLGKHSLKGVYTCTVGKNRKQDGGLPRELICTLRDGFPEEADGDGYADCITLGYFGAQATIRPWDPFTCVIAAGVHNRLIHFPIRPGSQVFVLDCTLRTLSHLSDIVGSAGRLVGVIGEDNPSKPSHAELTKFHQKHANVNIIFENIQKASLANYERLLSIPQASKYAVLMGLHPRLGRHSPIRVLAEAQRPQHIFRRVFDFLELGIGSRPKCLVCCHWPPETRIDTVRDVICTHVDIFHRWRCSQKVAATSATGQGQAHVENHKGRDGGSENNNGTSSGEEHTRSKRKRGASARDADGDGGSDSRLDGRAEREGRPQASASASTEAQDMALQWVFLDFSIDNVVVTGQRNDVNSKLGEVASNMKRLSSGLRTGLSVKEQMNLTPYFNNRALLLLKYAPKKNERLSQGSRQRVPAPPGLHEQVEVDGGQRSDGRKPEGSPSAAVPSAPPTRATALFGAPELPNPSVPGTPLPPPSGTAVPVPSFGCGGGAGGSRFGGGFGLPAPPDINEFGGAPAGVAVPSRQGPPFSDVYDPFPDQATAISVSSGIAGPGGCIGNPDQRAAAVERVFDHGVAERPQMVRGGVGRGLTSGDELGLRGWPLRQHGGSPAMDDSAVPLHRFGSGGSGSDHFGGADQGQALMPPVKLGDSLSRGCGDTCIDLGNGEGLGRDGPCGMHPVDVGGGGMYRRRGRLELDNADDNFAGGGGSSGSAGYGGDYGDAHRGTNYGNNQALSIIVGMANGVGLGRHQSATDQRGLWDDPIEGRFDDMNYGDGPPVRGGYNQNMSNDMDMGRMQRQPHHHQEHYQEQQYQNYHNNQQQTQAQHLQQRRLQQQQQQQRQQQQQQQRQQQQDRHRQQQYMHDAPDQQQWAMDGAGIYNASMSGKGQGGQGSQQAVQHRGQQGGQQGWNGGGRGSGMVTKGKGGGKGGGGGKWGQHGGGGNQAHNLQQGMMQQGQPRSAQDGRGAHLSV